MCRSPGLLALLCRRKYRRIDQPNVVGVCGWGQQIEVYGMLWWASESHVCSGNGVTRTGSTRTEAGVIVAAAQPRHRKVDGQFRPTCDVVRMGMRASGEGARKGKATRQIMLWG